MTQRQPAARTVPRVHPLARDRVLAYGMDCVLYFGLAVATVPAGLLAHQLGWGGSRAFVVAASSVPVLAATLYATARESGAAAATWGKRRLGLTVRAPAGRPGAGRALARNVVKIGLPWTLGHLVAIGAATGGFETGDLLTLAATVVTYPLLAVMVGTVALGAGRGLHDRLAGTGVERVTPAEPSSPGLGGARAGP